MNKLNEIDSADRDIPHPLLTWSEERIGLGVPVMDGYHQEFLSILSALGSMPDSIFVTLLKELVHHTREHFGQEENLMKATHYGAVREHVEEHRRVMADLQAMLDRAERGRMSMPREFIKIICRNGSNSIW